MTAHLTASGGAAPAAAPALREPARHLPLEGTWNVRDAGGYPTRDGRTVRWRTLYRADSLHRLTEQGQAHLIEAGLRTVVDLRRDAELAAAPNVLAESDRLRYLWVSLAPNPTETGQGREVEADTLRQTYRTIVDERGPELRQILGVLAGPGAFPALVHCTAGKDRTGLVVALLLGLAGVEHTVIAEDYALTATYLGDGYVADARQRAEAAGYRWEAYQHLLGCPAELMLETLAHLDERYGGVAPYLRGIGLTADELAALRSALVTDHSSEHLVAGR
jgi:protein-tyrosine phosphatase